MSVEPTLAPMSKGAWLMLFFGLMIPIAGFFGPYALRMATSPWAWTSFNKDSLTGTWVGTLTVSPARMPGSRAGAAGQVQIPTLIEMHMQVFTWLSHVSGTVKTCQSGVVSETPYTLGDVTLGTPDGDAVRLVFGSTPSFRPIRGVRQNDSFTVELGTGSDAGTGVLHKGSQADFDALCR